MNQLITNLSSGEYFVSNPRQYIIEVKPSEFVKLRAGDMAIISVEF